MKRSGHDLTLLIGVAALAYAGSTLAQPKVDLPANKPLVTRAPAVKAEQRGRGAYLASADVRAIESSGQTDVVSRSIPPGDYWLLAKGVLVNDANTPVAVACGLHDGGYAPSSGKTGIDYVSITVPGRSRAALTLTGSHANPGPTNRTLRVSCQTSNGARSVARWVKLSALAVDSITGDDERTPASGTPRGRVPRARP
jgi:hypothetical protein